MIVAYDVAANNYAMPLLERQLSEPELHLENQAAKVQCDIFVYRARIG